MSSVHLRRVMLLAVATVCVASIAPSEARSRGPIQLPAVQRKGQVQLPAVQRKGPVQLPAVQRKGQVQLPAVQRKGPVQLPAVQRNGRSRFRPVKAKFPTRPLGLGPATSGR